MSIFLCMSQRYRKALKIFDPLRGEWFTGIADPRSNDEGDGAPSWLRILLIGLIATVPLLLFSALPSITCGGQLSGKGGLLSDIGLWAITFYTFSTLILFPIMRRVLGDLLNELVLRGIVGKEFIKVTPANCSKGKLLTFLERWSRLEGYRGWIWFLIFFIEQTCFYGLFLFDSKSTWHTSPSTPGSLFYFAHVGNEQPNLAGIWGFLVLNPIAIYLVIIMARLIIVFACQCSELAQRKELKIIPFHPDGTGGLQPVGQVALLFALFTFIVGVDLAGMTINEHVVNTVFHPNTTLGGSNLFVLYGLCGLYLLLGSLLFFMPLLPLRKQMAENKRRYLLETNELYAVANQKHQIEVQNKDFNPDSLQGFGALHTMIQSVSGMAIWPFDRKTFIRYAGLLISPLTPLLSKQVSQVVVWIKNFVGISS